MSSKKSNEALASFKLFYEEIANIKPQTSRIRRIRQQSSASA